MLSSNIGTGEVGNDLGNIKAYAFSKICEVRIVSSHFLVHRLLQVERCL